MTVVKGVECIALIGFGYTERMGEGRLDKSVFRANVDNIGGEKDIRKGREMN